jgi:hypothetical protein
MEGHLVIDFSRIKGDGSIYFALKFPENRTVPLF